MGRCSIQIVMGPAGSGKSTYCQAMQEHCATVSGLNLHIGNCDPAAEHFHYTPTFDVRDLIVVEEVMEELQLGPNGALLYCMEYLLDHLDWLYDALEGMQDDDYLLLDCPGQIELYTHVPVQKRLIEAMAGWGYSGSMVSVFCIDAAFCVDASKFLSGSLLSLSAMIALELPHVSVLTKCDLMAEEEIERILNYGSASYLWDVDQNRQSLLPATRVTQARSAEDGDAEPEGPTSVALRKLEQRRRQRHRLTHAISELLDDWQMVSYVPLNIYDEESLEHVFQTVSHCIQYGEDADVRGADANEDAVTEPDSAED